MTASSDTPALRPRSPVRTEEDTSMRITHTSVFVDDQQKALLFYTGKLGS